MPDILVVALQRNRIIDESLNNNEVVNKFQILADAIIQIINSTLRLSETEDPSVAWLFIESEVLNYVESVNHLLSIAEEFLVKVIDEVINLVFSEDHVIGVEIGEAIVRAVAEVFSFVSTQTPVRVLVRQFVNRFQISETADPNKLFSKVIDEVVNFVTTSASAVKDIGLEIAQTVSEIVNSTESTILALGKVRVVSESLTLLDQVIGLAFVIGQVIMKFVSITAMRMTFWINRDMEQ